MKLKRKQDKKREIGPVYIGGVGKNEKKDRENGFVPMVLFQDLKI